MYSSSLSVNVTVTVQYTPVERTGDKICMSVCVRDSV